MNETNNAKVGRNEPCPCGSGKKYKRCHGNEPSVSTQVSSDNSDAGPGAPNGPQFPGIPGGLPEGMDPAQMMQMAQAIQRLPKGQLQQFQALLRKAMGGKDVSRELNEFQRTLPTDVQSMFMQLDKKDSEKKAAAPEGDKPPVQKEPSRFTKAWKGIFSKKT